MSKEARDDVEGADGPHERSEVSAWLVRESIHLLATEGVVHVTDATRSKEELVLRSRTSGGFRIEQVASGETEAAVEVDPDGRVCVFETGPGGHGLSFDDVMARWHQAIRQRGS